MKRLTLNQKLWSIVALMWVGLFIVVFMIGVLTRSRMIQERQELLKQQVNMALQTVSFFQKEAADNKLPVAEAKREAIEALRLFHWGKDHSGHFGVYDSAVTALLVPTDPSLEGKDQSAMVDPNGVHIATAIVRSSSPGGNGYCTYAWPKPGQSAPVSKMVYSGLVPDWNWHIFTGIYTDDINIAFRSVIQKNLTSISIIGLLLTAAMLWLIRDIRTRLGGEPDYAAEFCKYIASGDLSHTVDLRKGDTSSLLYAMAQMQTQLTETVGQIKVAADSITVGANEIAAGNADLSQRTEEQATALAQSAASMEELTATVKHNADNAVQASRLAATASDTVASGGKVVSQVVETILTIAESSKKIEQIISVIEGIAFQTNILALNAAVEAARAGEEGRGFAVVAGEVRTLAQRSASAAKEIKGLIDASVTNVSRGQSLAGEAGQSMQAILSSVQSVTNIMSEISAASSEQSTGISHVGVAIAQMDSVTQRNAALVEQATASAASLAEQAGYLKQSVASFRLAGA
jgi:methyl-accepting chemotaxis protein